MDAATADAAAVERGAKSLGGAFALALLVEAAMLIGVIAWLGDSPAPVDIAKPSMEISLVTLPAAPPPAPQHEEPPPVPEPPPPPIPVPPPPIPAPPPPEPVSQPKPAPPPKPAPKPVPQQVKPVPKLVEPAEPTRVADAPSVQFAPAPEPPRPVPPAPSPDMMAGFDSQVRSAIQAAVAFPFAAREMHQYGQARVEFDYLDGKVSGVGLVQSSGFPLLDPAALAAVRTAHYPPPPRDAQGRKLHYVLWVRFDPGPSQ